MSTQNTVGEQLSLLPFSPELVLMDLETEGVGVLWEQTFENPFSVHEKNPFINPLTSDEVLNVKVDVRSFLDVPEINVGCLKEPEGFNLAHTQSQKNLSHQTNPHNL